MTNENIIRLHKHFTFLASGKFDESNFVKDYGKGGRTAAGEFTPERVKLIKSDSLRAKTEIETKFPSIIEITKGAK